MAKRRLHRGCLPYEVLIGETFYTVTYCKTKAEVHTDEDAVGFFSSGRSEIRVFDDGIVDLGHVLNSLIHEIMHGVCYHMHMELGDQEESFVHKTANGLTPVLRHMEMDWDEIKIT